MILKETKHNMHKQTVWKEVKKVKERKTFKDTETHRIYLTEGT